MYFEECIFNNVAETAPDGDKGARIVIRYSTYNDSSITFHSGYPADTGAPDTNGGTRHFEIYNNTFHRNNVNANINKWIWVRGASGVIANNIMDSASSSQFPGKRDIRLAVGCEQTGFTSYPVPYQIGQSAANDFSVTENPPSHPVLIFGNTGAATMDSNFISIEENGTGSDPGTNCANPGSYIQQNRDYYLDNNNRWNGGTTSWTAFTYPHPLRALTFVNHAEGQNATSTPVTQLATASFTATGGNIEVCGVRQDTDMTAPSSLTDSGGNNYTHVIASDASMSNADLLTVWWANIATGFTGAVTAHWAAGHSFNSILCRQYSGHDPNAPIDVAGITANVNGFTVNSITSNPFTTHFANEAIIVFVSSGATTQGYSAGSISGQTATNLFGDAVSGSQMTAGEDLIVSSTQSSIAASMNFASAVGAELSGVTLKAAN